MKFELILEEFRSQNLFYPSLNFISPGGNYSTLDTFNQIGSLAVRIY